MDALDEWMELLPWFQDGRFDTVVERLYKEECAGHTILPHIDDVLLPYRLLRPSEPHVVILGEEPYTSPALATGVPLSVPHECDTLPLPLQNIFLEIELDWWGHPPETGNLDGWVSQGVMMLNTSLSIREGQVGSHADLGWSSLIEETIFALAQLNQNIAFVFWGPSARRMRSLASPLQHLLLSSNGPYGDVGFFGSRPFSKINNYLHHHDKPVIDWSA